MLDLVEGDGARGLRGRLLGRIMMKQWKIPECNRYGVEGLTRRLISAGFAEPSTELVGAQMLPPATRFMRRPEARREHRKEFGWLGAYILQLSLSAIELVYEWRLADFALVTTVRGDAPELRA
jgi:hypothetical protein